MRKVTCWQRIKNRPHLIMQRGAIRSQEERVGNDLLLEGWTCVYQWAHIDNMSMEPFRKKKYDFHAGFLFHIFLYTLVTHYSRRVIAWFDHALICSHCNHLLGQDAVWLMHSISEFFLQNIWSVFFFFFSFFFHQGFTINIRLIGVLLGNSCYQYRWYSSR